MNSLTSTINQGTNDRYRGTDAAKDFAAVREEMSRLERRVNKLEDKVLK
jgi:polyhydroxyalkanoate synthesis regulator phasin